MTNHEVVAVVGYSRRGASELHPLCAGRLRHGERLAANAQAVMSQNIRDASSTTIDTNTGGNSSIVYNCGYASNPGGQMPQGFIIQPGSYKEVAGS